MRIQELDCINELARKHQTTGLTAAELTEREQLRQIYLKQILGQMTNILSVVSVVDSEGNDITPAKLRRAQAAGMQIQ
ncbi:DUF896 domain-containing protein [Neisseria yangbaofengii]|uniref:DUF896 domain-containing protein n=1 Tax=Neisseria yangbaofengii TaxID=2709396 RepID=UPI0013EB9E81|nr:DUF896 domain-containing protein [Neisseria yangbaofengii]